MLLRILLFTVLALVIFFGVRRIWRDWTGKFTADAERERQLRRQRDLAERRREDVIDLRRDADGTYRPGHKRDGKDDDKRH